MRALLLKNVFTKCAGILILTVIFSKALELRQWENDKKVIASDVRGYYGYLPALFIYNDIQLKDTKPYKIDGEVKLWCSTTKDGQRFIKYSPGMAMMYSPFFAIGHFTAKNSNAPPNGYSEPYRFWLVVGSLFYMVLGLFFVSKLLLHHFSDSVAATTLLIVYLGTNLFYYTAYDGQLSHNYSFLLLGAFLYGSVKWLEKARWKYVILIGISGGLLIAVRQIDLIFLPFIIFYGVHRMSDLKLRFQLFWSHKEMLFTALGLIFLMLLPQMLYHYYVLGSPFEYSYGDERFFFGSPNLLDSPFSYRNGWLVYSPIMVLSIVGLFFLRKYAPKYFTFSLIGLPIYYYVIASWWCWWFVGFGNRAYINMYPLLAVAIAALFTYLYSKKYWVSLPIHLLILAAIALNYFQSFQFNEGIIHWDSMSKQAYWHNFGREKPSQMQTYLFEYPDNQAAKRGEDSVHIVTLKDLKIETLDFEKTKDINPAYSYLQSENNNFTGHFGLSIPLEYEFCVNHQFRIPKGTTHVHVTAWTRGLGNEVLAVKSLSGDYSHLSEETLQTKGEWRQLELMANLPKNHHFDSLEFFVWNKDGISYSIDDVEIICQKVGSKHVPY